MITNLRIMLERKEKTYSQELLWIKEEREARNDFKALNLKKKKSVQFTITRINNSLKP